MSLHHVMLATAMLLTSSQGYPSGFPTQVCNSMFPHHGATPQTTDPPYTITVDPTTYTPGSGQSPITVTVTSQNGGFKGLNVQARSLSNCNQTVGTFQLDASETDLKLLACDRADDSVSHGNAHTKTTKTFSWIPPATGMGHVYIRATVVESERVFWNTLRSQIISQDATDGPSVVSCPVPSTRVGADVLDGPDGGDGNHAHDHDDDDEDEDDDEKTHDVTGNDPHGDDYDTHDGQHDDGTSVHHSRVVITTGLLLGTLSLNLL